MPSLVTTPRRASPLLAALFVAACRELTGADVVYGERPAVIDPIFGLGIGSVVAADSVRVGGPLAVAVPTQGGGCTRRGETRVRVVSALEVEVLPYDSVPVRFPANFGCTDELRVLDHSAVVRYFQRGTAILRVRGRSTDAGGGGREIVLERLVVVY